MKQNDQKQFGNISIIQKDIVNAQSI